MRWLKSAFFIILLFGIAGLLHAQTEQQIRDKLKQQGITSEQEIKEKATKDPDSLNRTNQQPAPSRTTKITTPRQIDSSTVIIPPVNKPLSTYAIPAFAERDSIAANLDAFGYRVFSYSPSTFLPLQNIPTPTNYVFGPGDEIIITLYGETQFVHDLVVSNNGDINIPDVGVVDVNGLTPGALKTKLFNRLSAVYSTLKNSKTFFKCFYRKIKKHETLCTW